MWLLSLCPHIGFDYCNWFWGPAETSRTSKKYPLTKAINPVVTSRGWGGVKWLPISWMKKSRAASYLHVEGNKSGEDEAQKSVCNRKLSATAGQWKHFASCPNQNHMQQRAVIIRRFYFLSADWGAAAGNKSSWGSDSQSAHWVSCTNKPIKWVRTVAWCQKTRSVGKFCVLLDFLLHKKIFVQNGIFLDKHSWRSTMISLIDYFW